MRSLGRSGGRLGIKRRAWASGKKYKEKSRKKRTKEPPAAAQKKKVALETNVIWNSSNLLFRNGPRSGTVSRRNRRKQTPSHRVPIFWGESKNAAQRRGRPHDYDPTELATKRNDDVPGLPHPSLSAALGKDSKAIEQAREYSSVTYPCTCYASR